MTRRRTERRTLQRRGFTLTETLIEVVLSSVVLTGVYFIFANSSDAYRVQGQIGGLINNLRFAGEHIKMDLERAGFLATPNSEQDAMANGGAVCHSAAAQPLVGITIHRDGEENAISQTVHQAGANPNILPTSITMFGDYWSQGPVSVHLVTGNLIELDGSTYNGGDFPAVTMLSDWFREGRLVRLQNTDGLEMYYYVDAFNNTGGGPSGTWPVLQVNEAVPVVYGGGGCGVTGQGTGTLINPVGYIRYRVAQDTRQGAPADKYDLVREELDPDDLSIVAQSQLTIAEYAVDLQFYDYAVLDALPPTPPALTLHPDVRAVSGIGGGGILGGGSSSTPELLRGLTFKISLRTREEDPNVTHIPRPGRWDRLITFDVDTNVGGAARVRSSVGRIVLDNFITL